jgi:hypothetical protein
MNDDLNREFAELCGICWHETVDTYQSYRPSIFTGKPIKMKSCSCGAELLDLEDHDYLNPDFVADPRLVLREMKRILSNDDFEDWLCEVNEDDVFCQIDVSLILDQTGLLVKAAIEWKRRKG